MKRVSPFIVILTLATSASVGPPTVTLAQLDAAQQKCAKTLLGGLTKLDRIAAHGTTRCLRRRAGGQPLGSPAVPLDTLEECVAGDPFDRLLRTREKLDADFERHCTAPLPPFAATDPTTVADAARDKDRGLVHDVFGADLDAAIPAGDPDALRCQVGAWKAVVACESERLDAFRSCARKSLAGRGAAPAEEAGDLTVACLGAGSGQPDPTGRIDAQCTGQEGILAAACAGQDLTSLLPGCPAGDIEARGACLARLAACRVCLALDAAADLGRDCDQFDDGGINGSCPQLSPITCPCWSAEAIDATFPPGYFMQNGRGGVQCAFPEPDFYTLRVESRDTCVVTTAHIRFDSPRAGVGFVGGLGCLLHGDYDPAETGDCSGIPIATPTSDREQAACESELRASQLWQSECAPLEPTP